MSVETAQAALTEPVKAAETPAPVVETEKKPDEMSSKFAALARKERMARMAQQRTRAQLAELAEREKKVAERERLWDEEFQKTPLEAIKKRGYSYEDLTKAALNDGRFDPTTEIKSVKEEIARVRQEQQDKEKKFLEDQKAAEAQAEQQVVDSFKENITRTIEEKKDTYELTHLYEASELVFQTIEEHFARTKQSGAPKIMSVQEACELVEQYLESEVERMAKTSKKFQTKYGAPKAEEKSGAGKSSVTLNNQLQSSSAPSLLSPNVENDRIKRALAALG